MLEKKMLVLSRKKEQRIVINDDIVITVVDIGRDKVRIGIDAPKEIPVHRHEVYQAIQESASEVPAPPEKPVVLSAP